MWVAARFWKREGQLPNSRWCNCKWWGSILSAASKWVVGLPTLECFSHQGRHHHLLRKKPWIHGVLVLNFGKSRILAAISLRGVFGAASGGAIGLLQNLERESWHCSRGLEQQREEEHSAKIGSRFARRSSRAFVLPREHSSFPVSVRPESVRPSPRAFVPVSVRPENVCPSPRAFVQRAFVLLRERSSK
ncbi:hypothetical protein LR48_Vigan04g180800 [Vigna angularis]|uniref:Uncharacterized protein n=1 Tax=Phaseolus angularis TaxID=3914 RepID=A0A0L9UFD8_PHAAN|nr:hypothetical protein LR48_Vigan04g180800 [Vigna angularis]